MAAPTISNALIILFDGFNTLDVNGPFEVFKKSGTSQHFNVTVASATQITKSIEGAQLQRDIVLDDDLVNSVRNYDILIVPGGETQHVLKQASDISGPFMQVIQQFTQQPLRSESFPPILLSICTGAFFLGTLGIFNNGRLCTTHWKGYSTLATVNNQAAVESGPDVAPGLILQARYVDSGLNEVGVRIISGGGISCGIDSSLHVVKIRVNEDEAFSTAMLLDYAWRQTDGVSYYEGE